MMMHMVMSGTSEQSSECDVSTLCTSPAKGMHPGHTVNILHSGCLHAHAASTASQVFHTNHCNGLMLMAPTGKSRSGSSLWPNVEKTGAAQTLALSHTVWSIMLKSIAVSWN
jgi:hypothetical protein